MRYWLPFVLCAMLAGCATPEARPRLWTCEAWSIPFIRGEQRLVADPLTLRTYGWPIWGTLKDERRGRWVVALEGSEHEVEVDPEMVVDLRRCKRWP